MCIRDSNKILTMESSGISIAVATAVSFDKVPVVFAKKTAPSTMVEDVYHAEVRSFTRGIVSSARVAKKFLSPKDRILIIDDFLAHGAAASGLAEIVNQAGATLVGVGVVIEKAFQGGREKLATYGCPCLLYTSGLPHPVRQRAQGRSKQIALGVETISKHTHCIGTGQGLS